MVLKHKQTQPLSFLYESGVCCNSVFGCASCPTEASSGALAGIISSVGVALLGAASSYFAYQKKKLCFKVQGGQYVHRIPYINNT